MNERNASLLIMWLWEGKWNRLRCRCGFIKSLIEDSKRLIEKVCCTAQRDMNLLERLLPSPLLVEGLKTAMMFVHDRLLRIHHETINGCHRCLPLWGRGCTVTDLYLDNNDTNGG